MPFLNLLVSATVTPMRAVIEAMTASGEQPKRAASVTGVSLLSSVTSSKYQALFRLAGGLSDSADDGGSAGAGVSVVSWIFLRDSVLAAAARSAST